jgi:hypothetical protein
MEYLGGQTGQNFDPVEYMSRFDLSTPLSRLRATRLDPMLFGLVYMRKHLTDKVTGTISMADLHLDMCRRARQWARTDLGMEEIRDAWIAWRESGKSTWNFLILPAWALAHGHRQYCLAFADSGPQAQTHLMTFKLEIGRNMLLRRDFPGLVRPGKRNEGVNASDNRAMYISQSGVVFHAKGIDSSTLGTKVGDIRPDLILLDDIEPDESNYSELQKDKRLATVLQAVFPMNQRAAVSLTGTVTMAGSIVDDIARKLREPNAEDLPSWPADSKFRARYYPLMRLRDDGEEESAHEQRFNLEWMQSRPEGAKRRVCERADFLLNYQNSPRGKEGGWWTLDDFRYGDRDDQTRWIIQIDPAVTETGKSDFTAITVTSCSDPNGKNPIVVHHYALQVKMVGEPLRRKILQLLDQFPRVKLVRVESNQGGELWLTILRGLPVRVVCTPSTQPKVVRLGWGLDWYQRGRVWHAEKLSTLENYQLGYPKGLHDDLPDCACLATLYFLGRPPRREVMRKAESYVR